ncbi:MAG: ABC transporter permease [Lachnospiraceae bacterium]|nr:ABC transporter permease [Lachnospiraceae bacterium]
MTLSKKDFQGTGKVFSFTLLQMLKNKANLVSLIIMVLFSLLSVPFMVLTGGADMHMDEEFMIQTAYIRNETNYTIDLEQIAELEPELSAIAVKEAEFEAEDYEAHLNPGELLIRIYQESLLEGFVVEASALTEDESESYEASLMMGAVLRVFDQARYEAMGITEEQIAVISSSYEVNVTSVDDFLNPETTSFDTRYWLQYIYAIVIMVLSILAVSYIIRAIVEEKASKLVELLMVSVKPLALVVGKILASMVFVFGMIASMVLGFVISYLVSSLFFDVSVVGGIFGTLGISADSLNVDAPAIVSIVISVLTGFTTFSILAGLFGSACSSTSEMESAIMAPTMITMAGYLVSVAISGMNGGPVVIFCSLCPIISVFCGPVQYLVGNIGFPVLVLSWVLQLAVVVLLALFCAKIYRELIIYRGSRVTVKQMIAMAMGKSGKGKVN